jgi:hypothetical protein
MFVVLRTWLLIVLAGIVLCGFLAVFGAVVISRLRRGRPGGGPSSP